MKFSFFVGLVLALFVSSSTFAQGKFVSCAWDDGTDYFIYEIDDESNSFRFSTTFDYGVDALSTVPHGESANYKEYVVSFSRQKIEHCRLDKRKDIEACYTLNRVKGTFTKQRGSNDPITTSCSAGLPESKF